MSEHTAIGKLNADAASGGVLIKLIVFSLSLGILPLTSYFASLKYVWDGNATFAAITAVVTANIVLVTYVVMSLLEDKFPGVQQQHTETRKEK